MAAGFFKKASQEREEEEAAGFQGLGLQTGMVPHVQYFISDTVKELGVKRKEHDPLPSLPHREVAENLGVYCENHHTRNHTSLT